MSLAERDLDPREPVAPESAQPGLRAFLLTIAYDGSGYCGWQRQPEQATVQATLEQALFKATGDKGAKALASSRTDTGVHAIGQSVLYRTTKWPAAAERLPFAVNTKLPLDIVVREAREVSLDFYPLRHSTGKRYRYLFYSSRKADPINARTHWWIRRRVCLANMQTAASYLVGEHDFQSFESTGSPRNSTVRKVRRLDVSCVEHMDGILYTVEIEANGFLYNMVRNIVGTLVQVGVGREKPEWIKEVLTARDRRVAGATAPPQGLCLVEVYY